MDVLDQVLAWPVDNAAAAIVGDHGVLATAGDQDRVFALASVTKLLVAYAVLVAVEEGAVELDQPAGPPGSTVRHLLAHASGLAFGEPVVQRAVGERRIYSSAGYEVLADFVAAETGIGFAQYLHEAVCEPLGMSATVLDGPAGHGARSCAADLTRFCGELLRPRLLSAATFREATTLQFPGLSGVVPGYGPQTTCDWGLGFELRDHKSPHWLGERNSPETAGHFGQAGTFVWFDPALRTAAVVLTDRKFGDWAKPLWQQFNDEIVDATAK